MIKNLFSYIKRKYEKNTLSWKLVSPPGIIAGIIQLVRSLVFCPFSTEVITDPIYIWYTRLSLSIITIIFGTISFIKPSKYYICTFPLCCWGLFMIHQKILAIGFMVFCFGCFVSTKKDVLNYFPEKTAYFYALILTIFNLLCYFNGGWQYVKTVFLQEFIILFLIGSTILLLLPEINYYLKTKSFSHSSIETFDLSSLKITLVEYKIIQGVLSEKNYKEIATENYTSESFVKKTMARILNQLDLTSKDDFITLFKNTKFIKEPDT